MENNGIQPPQPTAPTPPTAQPVVDVQPSQPAAPAVNSGWPSAAPPPPTGVGSVAPTPAPGMASAPPAWGAPEAPSAAPAPVTMATPPPATAEVNAGPVPAPVDVNTLGEAATSDTSSQDKPADDHNPMAIPANAQVKRKVPIGVIICAILVAVLLAGVAVFAYMKMQKKTTSEKVNVPIIGAKDVDTTEKQLEDSLAGVDDSKDFAAGDLSDAALGL